MEPPHLTYRNTLVPVGEAAPDFSASTSHGEQVVLSEFRNLRKVVLFFYPGDFTPVCTAQLCAVRDCWEFFQDSETIVFGINPLHSRIHAQFAARNRLPFPLIEDRHGEICAAYGCRMLFATVRRTVYIVNKEGRIAFAERGTPSIERILSIVRGPEQRP